jgi:hypothetical protein
VENAQLFTDGGKLADALACWFGTDYRESSPGSRVWWVENLGDRKPLAIVYQWANGLEIFSDGKLSERRQIWRLEYAVQFVEAAHSLKLEIPTIPEGYCCCHYCGKITRPSGTALDVDGFNVPVGACAQCERVVFSIETAREMIEAQGWDELVEVQWLLGEIELLAEMLGVKL